MKIPDYLNYVIDSLCQYNSFDFNVAHLVNFIGIIVNLYFEVFFLSHI